MQHFAYLSVTEPFHAQGKTVPLQLGELAEPIVDAKDSLFLQ